MASQKVWEALRDALTDIGALEIRQATGGSTTTLVDSAKTTGSANTYKGGFAIVLRDAGGANAAPEGEMATISNYSSGTWTIGTITAAAASGDRFGVTKARFTLPEMIELLNKALRERIGNIVYVDTTTLDSTASQTEYTQSVDWKRNPLRIDMQTKTGDSNDNRWVRIWDVREVPANPGSTGLFVLPQLSSGYDLRVWYKSTHPAVNAYSDSIAEIIHPELVKAALVAEIQNFIAEKRQNSDDASKEASNKAEAKFEMALQKHYRLLHRFDDLENNLPSYLRGVLSAISDITKVRL